MHYEIIVTEMRLIFSTSISGHGWFIYMLLVSKASGLALDRTYPSILGALLLTV
jgi:hypothetical protein